MISLRPGEQMIHDGHLLFAYGPIRLSHSLIIFCCVIDNPVNVNPSINSAINSPALHLNSIAGVCCSYPSMYIPLTLTSYEETVQTTNTHQLQSPLQMVHI